MHTWSMPGSSLAALPSVLCQAAEHACPAGNGAPRPLQDTQDQSGRSGCDEGVECVMWGVPGSSLAALRAVLFQAAVHARPAGDGAPSSLQPARSRKNRSTVMLMSCTAEQSRCHAMPCGSLTALPAVKFQAAEHTGPAGDGALRALLFTRHQLAAWSAVSLHDAEHAVLAGSMGAVCSSMLNLLALVCHGDLHCSL